MDTEEFDIDDMDFGDDMGGFDLGIEDQGEPRKPADAFVHGAMKAVKGEELRQSLKRNLANDNLPEGYHKATDKLSDVKDNLERTYDESKKILKGPIKGLKKTLSSKIDHFPFLPEKYKKNLRELLKDDDEYSYGYSSSRDNNNETQITDTLDSIFNKTTMLQAGVSETQTNIALENQKINEEQFSISSDLMQTIANNTTNSLNIQKEIQTAYERKSLELQMRQFYATKELVDMTKAGFHDSVQNLANIAKNTGLPDLVKVRGTEVAKQMLFQKALGRVTDKGADVLKNAGANVLKNINNKARDGADFAGSMIEQFVQMGEATEQMMEGKDRNEAYGELAVETGIPALVSKLNKKLIGDKIKDNKTVANFGNILEFLVESGPLGISKLAKRQVDKLDNGLIKSGLESGLSIFDVGEARGESVSNELRGEATTPVPFDNLTRRSIVEIIPGFLSQTLKVVTDLRDGVKDSPMMTYSIEKEQFVTMDSESKRLRDQIINTNTSGDRFNSIKKILDILDPGAKLSVEDRMLLATNIMERSRKGNDVIMIEDYNSDNINSTLQMDDEAAKDRISKVVNLSISSSKRVQTKGDESLKILKEQQRLGDGFGRLQDIINIAEVTGTKNQLLEAGLLDRDSSGNYRVNIQGLQAQTLDDIRQLMNNNEVVETESVVAQRKKETEEAERKKKAQAQAKAVMGRFRSKNKDSKISQMLSTTNEKLKNVTGFDIGSSLEDAGKSIDELVSSVKSSTKEVADEAIDKFKETYVYKKAHEIVSKGIIEDEEAYEQALDLILKVEEVEDVVEIKHSTIEDSKPEGKPEGKLPDPVEIIQKGKMRSEPHTAPVLTTSGIYSQSGFNMARNGSEGPIRGSFTTDYSIPQPKVQHEEENDLNASMEAKQTEMENELKEEENRTRLFETISTSIQEGIGLQSPLYNLVNEFKENTFTRQDTTNVLLEDIKGLVSGLLEGNIAEIQTKDNETVEKVKKKGLFGAVISSMTNKAKNFGGHLASVSKFNIGATTGLFGAAASLGVGSVKFVKGKLTVTDVYMSGSKSPVMTRKDLLGGFFRDSETQKVLKSYKDITKAKGDIIDIRLPPEGNVVVSRDQIKDLYINQHGGKIKRLGDGIFSMLSGSMSVSGLMHKTGVGALALAGRGLKLGFDQFFKPKDLYLPGEDSPVMLGRLIATGNFYFVDGNPVRNEKDITGTVTDKDGNVIVTMEMVPKLIRSDGQPVGKTFIGKQFDRVKKIGSHIWNTQKKLVKAVNTGIKTGAKMGIGMINAVPGVHLGFDNSGGNDYSNESGNGDSGILSYLEKRFPMDTKDRIYKLLNSRLPQGKKKRRFFDSDGDGDRDGSYRDQMSKRKGKKKEDKGLKILGLNKNEKKGFSWGTLLGVLGTVVGTLTSGFGAVTSVLGSIAGAFGAKKLLDMVKGGKADVGGPKKPGMLSKLGSAIGSGFSKVKSVAGSALSFAKNKGASLALKVGSKVATRGALAFLGPIGAVVGAGMLAYDAYSYYQSVKDPKGIDRLRFMLYGMDPTNNSHLKAIRALESEINDTVEIKNGQLSVKENLQHYVDKVGSLFDLDTDEPETIMNFRSWFEERFLKVYLAFVLALKSFNIDSEIEDLDSEIDDKDIRVKFTRKVTSVKILNLLNYQVSPFADGSLFNNQEDINRLIRELIGESTDQDKKQVPIKSEEVKKLLNGKDTNVTSINTAAMTKQHQSMLDKQKGTDKMAPSAFLNSGIDPLGDISKTSKTGLSIEANLLSKIVTYNEESKQIQLYAVSQRERTNEILNELLAVSKTNLNVNAEEAGIDEDEMSEYEVKSKKLTPLVPKNMANINIPKNGTKRFNN